MMRVMNLPMVWMCCRAVLFIGTCLAWIQRGVFWLAHEFLWKISSESSRFFVNQKLYEREIDYLPGQAFFNRGLFEWESRLLAHPSFPRSGRLLLFAAGGGREADAFSKKGYRVVALEPNPLFLSRGKAFTSCDRNILWAKGSFNDWLLNHESVRFLTLDSQFEAVWVGWGAFSYLFSPEHQRAFLLSIKTSFPRAPVVLSFLVHPRPRAWPSLIRNACSKDGLGSHRVFLPKSGFSFMFTADQIRELAETTGYAIECLEMSPYPHAFLAPLKTLSSSS